MSAPRRSSAGLADGYTLLIAGSNAAINATLFEQLNFVFLRDTAPIASIVRVPQLMQVTPSLPVHSVPEFIAYAKANPGKIAMGSGGNGSPAHVIGEYFKLMTGTDLTHVPYRGAAPAVTDLLGGQIQVAFTEMATSLAHVRSGNLRALAVTTAARTEALPDVPTLSEFIPGFEASQWVGLVAPKDAPGAIIETLNREINVGLGDPKLKARFADLGGMVLPGSPADFGRADPRRDREMGQGDPRRQHQGGLSVRERIGALIRAYENQGFHRTGTAVDRLSAEWLAGEIRQIGLAPTLEDFPLSRVDPVSASLAVNGRTIEGLPLFDGGFTGAAGIAGRLGSVGQRCTDRALRKSRRTPQEAGALGDARRQNRHQAIVVVTRGARPGFCPSNADSFLRPFGPPVLQVASDEAPRSSPIARDRARRRC